MNTKLLTTFVGLFAVSAVSASLEATSTDGSLPADIAAIPLCGQEELANAGFALQSNDRKKQCQTTLKIDELLKISPSDTTTLKTMCKNVACTAALKALYPVLPDCRYKDWPFKRTVESELKYCGIDPATITKDDANTTSSNAGDIGNRTTTMPPVKFNGTSSTPGTDFAPVGAVPSPSPTTQTPSTPVPTTTKSAGNSVYAATSTVIVAVVAVAAGL